MFDKLSNKDKRTIRLGAFALAIILAYAGLNSLLKEYSKTSKALDAERAKFNSVLPNDDGSMNLKQAGLYKIVPVFEMPVKEDLPGSNFQKKFMEQLKKSGVKFTVLNLLPMSSRKNAAGFKTRDLHCKGKCSFDQAMNLLASLYENPLFVGVEEFKVECNPKNRREMELTIRISTFIK